MRRLFSFHYPKIAILLVMIILAYLIFSNQNVQSYISSLNSLNYLGMFLAGILFSSGFTTPIAVGYFVVANPSNIWLTAILGGFGACLADLLIFKLIRFSFMDEFRRLEKTKPIKETSFLIENFLGHQIKVYLMYAFAGLLFASPLPDEAAIIMLAGLTHVKTKPLILISFTFNTLGILIMLLI